MISGTVPILYILAQAIVEYMPEVPSMSFETELPLAIVDGFTRSFLLCTLVPPTVTQNASALISTSPWALLLSSLVRSSIATYNLGYDTDTTYHDSSPTPASS